MIPSAEAFRPRLFGIAYRMLGTVMDAEDAVQETFLRAQKAGPGGIENVDAYLRTTIIHLCLNRLREARETRETYFGPWLPEPLLTDPLDKIAQDDSISMAFLLLLERLSPEERAALVLREVFDYDYAAIAETLGKSQSACRKLVSRAKGRIGKQPPQRAPPDEHRATLARFVQGLQSGDLTGLMDLLTADVVLTSDGGGKASAATRPLIGPQLVATFMNGLARRLSPTDQIAGIELNGREGFYVRDGTGKLVTVGVFEVMGGRINRLYFILNPDKLGAIYAYLGSATNHERDFSDAGEHLIP